MYDNNWIVFGVKLIENSDQGQTNLKMIKRGSNTVLLFINNLKFEIILVETDPQHIF